MLDSTINKDFVSCFPKKVFNKNGNVLLDSLREESSSDFIVLDGTDEFSGSNGWRFTRW